MVINTKIIADATPMLDTYGFQELMPSMQMAK